MKHHIKHALLYSIAIIALYSCISMGKIGIQVSVPPKNPISPEIQSIAILNRSMTPDFINFPDYSIEKNLIVNKRSEMSLLDSCAADTAIKVAAKALYESQRFDVVVPLQANILRDENFSILNPLDSTSINELCKDFKVDGILVLESFYEGVNGGIYGMEDFYKYVYDGVIDVYYKLAWRLYQKQPNFSVLSFVVSDDIFWESGRYYSTEEEAVDKLPTIKEALIGGGIAAGQDIAENIGCTWVDETRNFYITRNKKIDAAIPLIKQNKWEEAAEIWMKYSSVSSKSLRSKIEYNLALATEMMGDIEGANEWEGKSLKSKYSRNAEDYLMNLGRHSLIQSRYSRYYYTTGNRDIDSAVPLIKLNKWDEAVKIWKKYYGIPDKTLRSKIEYNLALSEEMKGNVDLAIEWSAKSLKTNNLLSTRQYLKELKQISQRNKDAKNSIRRTSSYSGDTGQSLIPWLDDFEAH